MMNAKENANSLPLSGSHYEVPARVSRFVESKGGEE